MHTRRVFLKTVVVGSAATACVGCGGSGATKASGGGVVVSAGPASALAEGTVRALMGEGVCIARDAGGIYAMSLVCTHEECDISIDGMVSAAGITCSCHGSQFDANGNVVRGPAGLPLSHLAVSADKAGNLTIHWDTTVDPSARLVI